MGFFKNSYLLVSACLKSYELQLFMWDGVLLRMDTCCLQPHSQGQRSERQEPRPGLILPGSSALLGWGSPILGSHFKSSFTAASNKWNLGVLMVHSSNYGMLTLIYLRKKSKILLEVIPSIQYELKMERREGLNIGEGCEVQIFCLIATAKRKFSQLSVTYHLFTPFTISSLSPQGRILKIMDTFRH